MTVKCTLSDQSIENAIRKLESLKEELMKDVGEIVDILLTDGEQIANVNYGSMATAWGRRESEDDGIINGVIEVRGSDTDITLMAEFGAGDATVDPKAFFDLTYDDAFILDLYVYPGAYSLMKGSMEYWYSSLFGTESGYWHFGGQKYTQVEPKLGLYQAKMHLLTNGNDIAREVLRS